MDRPVILAVQESPPSLLTLTLTSSSLKLSLMVSGSQFDFEPASSPFLVMMMSTVLFSWISNS